MTHAEPTKATRFYDARSGRHMLLNLDQGCWFGWIFYKHPDGQWVSLRQATKEDTEKINRAVIEAHHVRTRS